MRNENVGGVAAINGDAEMTGIGAQILLATETGGANAIADPRIDRDAVADFGAASILAFAVDHAGNLVTEREGQGASGADVELLVAAEREIAVLHVQIGM